MSKTRKALLTLLLLALARRPLELLLSAVWPGMATEVFPCCLAALTGTLLALALPAWLLHPWRSDRLTRRRPVLSGMAEGACAALLTRMAGVALDAAWQTALALTPRTLPAPGTLTETLLSIAALVIVPALAEECFFRGAVLTSLLDGASRVSAILLTAAFFALMHTSLANLPSLLLFSLVLTLLMLRTGRITAPIAAHLVYNLTALFRLSLPLWVSLLCGAALVCWLVRTSVRLPKRAHPPMQTADMLLAAASLGLCLIFCFL